MTHNYDDLNRFQELYGVRDVELSVEPNYPIFAESASGKRGCYLSSGDEEVTLRMSGMGFRKMTRDLCRPETGLSYFQPTFEIDKLDASDDALWLAKFDLDHRDISTINMLAERLISEFPDKKIIFIPKDINIEKLQLEGLITLRDNINSIIESLNYDNIMGF